MLGRLFGFCVTMGVIFYLFHSMNSSDEAVQKAMNSPAMQEQKKILEAAGIDPNDPDAVRKYTEKKAREIEQYQNQNGGVELPKE
jgi:hypothetical protein